MASIIVTIDVPDGSSTRVNTSENRAAESPQADPWGDGDTGTNGNDESAPASRSEPRGANAGRPASGTATDERGKQWKFNAAGSPSCQCGNPAALVSGKTNGKTWSQWRCAKAYDDWRNKCDFAQWPD
jgi:hypothetical protein